ncbi:AAA family ATPase, partial [Candidatus Woesearchaeota archaeon]|nr:AAA family ATPase [Candidatus Woesearchaeota archaeon]
MTWSVKYKLKEIEDIVGQDLIVEKLKDYIKNFSVHKGKAILLYGPTGSGKTSIVHALANHFNNELFEINSSDIRNKEKIEELVGAAATQMSLFGTKKIILLDEVDNLSGTKDRGGAIAIAKIIPKSVFPIIMTANDAYASKLKEVRKKSLVLELEEINYNIIKNIFKKILEKEKI